MSLLEPRCLVCGAPLSKGAPFEKDVRDSEVCSDKCYETYMTDEHYEDEGITEKEGNWMKALVCKKDFFMRSKERQFTKGFRYEILHTNEYNGELDFVVVNDSGDRHTMPWDDHVKNHFDFVKFKEGK